MNKYQVTIIGPVGSSISQYNIEANRVEVSNNAIIFYEDKEIVAIYPVEYVGVIKK